MGGQLAHQTPGERIAEHLDRHRSSRTTAVMLDDGRRADRFGVSGDVQRDRRSDVQRHRRDIGRLLDGGVLDGAGWVRQRRPSHWAGPWGDRD